MTYLLQTALLALVLITPALHAETAIVLNSVDESVSFIAVSYTHLDVYKRQGYYHYAVAANGLQLAGPVNVG